MTSIIIAEASNNKEHIISEPFSCWVVRSIEPEQHYSSYLKLRQLQLQVMISASVWNVHPAVIYSAVLS